MLHELFALERTQGGGWHASSGAIWNLDSNEMRPEGWTSADAAGLPILPGVARWGEVAQGRIDHALRFTASQTRRAYIWPARLFASSSTNPALPPMGLRVRLKAGYDISGFPPQSRVVLQALKEYGMILADNGSDWYVSGVPNPGWSNDDLHSLHQVPGSALEVVDSSLLIEPLAGATRRVSRLRRAPLGAQPDVAVCRGSSTLGAHTQLSPSAAALSTSRARSEPYGKERIMTRVLTIDERPEVRAAERQIDARVAHDHATKEDVLDWQGFLSRYFPERRRHDLEAITAYAAYRSSGDSDERSSDSVPSTAEAELVAVVGSEAADAWEDEGGATV